MPLFDFSSSGGEITEIFFPCMTDTVAPGVGAFGFGTILANPSDTGNDGSGVTWTVIIPSTWETFDIVAVVQAETGPAQGNVHLAAYRGSNFDFSNASLAEVGTATVSSADILVPTEVVVAPGVTRPVGFFQVQISREDVLIDTFSAGDVFPYGMIVRKAS